jgi:VanZ family protein
LRICRAVFWLSLVAVTILSLLPAPYLPEQALQVWDKAQHSLAYAGLVLTGLVGRVGRGTVLAIGLLGHGVVVEITQGQLAWRRGDVLDWVADSVGVLVGYLLFRMMRMSAR